MKTRILVSLIAILLTVGAAGAAEKKTFDVVYLDESRPLLLRLDVTIDGNPLMDVYNAHLEKTFKALDTNADGLLNKEEAERMIPPQTASTARGPFGFRGNVNFDALDRNRDGRIDLTELTAYYRQQGFVPFQLLGGNEQDLYRSTVLRASGGGQSPTAEAINAALFKLLDADGDGKLSKAELAKAEDLLNRLDTDDDEILTVGEVMGEAPSSGGPYGGAVFVTDGAGGMAQGHRNFVLVTPGESAANLVRKLLEKYSPREKKLTQKDLGLDKETFAKLDQDEDGALDTEELAHFTDRPADLELTVRVGKRDGKAPMVEAVEKKAGTSVAKANQVRNGLSIDFGITRLTLGEGNDQDPMSPRFTTVNSREINKQRYTMIFNQADADNNGYLDMKEAERTGFFGSMFKPADADGDGKLYLKEILAFVEKMEAQQAEAQASCVSLSVSDQGRGVFDLIDTNRDSRLGIRELRRVVKLLTDLDRDKDDCLTTAEVPRNYQVRIQQGNGAADPFAVRTVRIGGTPATPLPAAPTAGPVWFRKMDRNRDGDVSRKEFLGTEEEFKKIDADGDGLISVPEAEKFDAEMRKAQR